MTWPWERESVADRLIQQNNALMERLMADSEAKTRLLDKIVSAKFDPMVRGDVPLMQPESMVNEMLRTALSGEDDREFIEQAERGL